MCAAVPHSCSASHRAPACAAACCCDSAAVVPAEAATGKWQPASHERAAGRCAGTQGMEVRCPTVYVGGWILPQGRHLPVCHQEMQLEVTPLCGWPRAQRDPLSLWRCLAHLSLLSVCRPLQQGGFRFPSAAALASQTLQLIQRHHLCRLVQCCLWLRPLGQWLPSHAQQRCAQRLVAQFSAMQRRAGCCMFPCAQPRKLVLAPMASCRLCGAGLCPAWCRPQLAQHCNLQRPLKLLLRLQYETLQRSGHSAGVAGAQGDDAWMRGGPARGCWPHLQLSVPEHLLQQSWP